MKNLITISIVVNLIRSVYSSEDDTSQKHTTLTVGSDSHLAEKNLNNEKNLNEQKIGKRSLLTEALKKS